ncbi:MAG: hypothetical protein QM539_05675 [Alphaproteobacteria bacterium]|nr:hypothetical protein [Alphaproteobacteria bacterium]
MDEPIDYLIIGQGISGMMLAFYLWEQKISFKICDADLPFSASPVASGIINPVTGRRLVKTWMIDEILPITFNTYSKLSNLLHKNIIYKTYLEQDFIASTNIDNLVQKNTNQLTKYTDFKRLPLASFDGNHHIENSIHNNYKYDDSQYIKLKISPCFLIDVPELLALWKTFVINENLLITKNFPEHETPLYQHTPFSYDSYNFKNIIFCSGFYGQLNPFFNHLPFTQIKGEAVIANIQNVPFKGIYKSKYTMSAYKNSHYYIGTSYQRDFLNAETSETFLKNSQDFMIARQLNSEIIEQLSGVRSGTTMRRPFMGWHPYFKHIGIMNGMGTKGYSLAPFLAPKLIQNKLEHTPILKDVDIHNYFTF